MVVQETLPAGGHWCGRFVPAGQHRATTASCRRAQLGFPARAGRALPQFRPVRPSIGLLISREESASFLGLALETVSRGFTRLRDDGVIAINGRRIQILKPAVLWLSADDGEEQAARVTPDAPQFFDQAIPSGAGVQPRARSHGCSTGKCMSQGAAIVSRSEQKTTSAAAARQPL